MKAKKKLKNMKKLSSIIKNLIRSITKNSDDYDEKFVKTKFNSDDELRLNKMIEIPSLIIIDTAVFAMHNHWFN